jgi:hypothetical protein
MGTRSLLAVESKPGKYYVQYMQFDGYPSEKGMEFYETVLESLKNSPSSYVFKNKWEKPNRTFFTRIKHFLNEYQYQSGHSVGAHYTCPAGEWEKQDSGQEWQYLFDKDGNFTFFPNRHQYYCKIPWEFTINLARVFGLERKVSVLEPFWKAMSNWDGRTFPLKVSLDIGESLAFPDQGTGGWRNYGILSIGNKVIQKSMFSDTVPKRNQKSLQIQCKSEYLSVLNSPKETLPLFMNVQDPDARNLLSKKLQAS